MKTPKVKLPKLKFASERKYQYNDFNFRVGTSDKYTCKAVYIQLEMWMTSPIDAETSFEAIRRRFIAKLIPTTKIYISNHKTALFTYNYPTDQTTDVKKKPCFCSIEITILSNSLFTYDDDLIDSCKGYAATAFDLLESLDDKFEIKNHK
jgi:hypothetical protein